MPVFRGQRLPCDYPSISFSGETFTVGHHQTKQHRSGKHSYHQIGLVRGQFGNVPEDGWLDWIAKTGFDGWEEASWELDLGRCKDDAGAK